MKIVDLKQGSEEWLEWRRSKICASDIGAICGVSPFADAYDIFNQKKGLSTPYVNEAMRRGSFLEEPSRQECNQAYKANFVPIVVEFEDYGASLDGYDVEREEILEIKVVSKKSFDKILAEMPLHYSYQVQWQLMCTFLEKALFKVECHETGELAYIPIEARPEVQYFLDEEARNFLMNHLIPNIPPEPSVIAEVPPTEASIRLEDLLLHKDVLDEEIKKIKAQLLQESLIQDRSFYIGNLTVVYSSGRKTYNYKAMAKDGIPISNYEKTGKPSQSIRRRKSD